MTDYGYCSRQTSSTALSASIMSKFTTTSKAKQIGNHSKYPTCPLIVIPSLSSSQLNTFGPELSLILCHWCKSMSLYLSLTKLIYLESGPVGCKSEGTWAT